MMNDFVICILNNSVFWEALGVIATLCAVIVALWGTKQQKRKEQFYKCSEIYKKVKQIFASINEIYEYKDRKFFLMPKNMPQLNTLLSELGDYEIDIELFYGKTYEKQVEDYIKLLKMTNKGYGETTRFDRTNEKTKADLLKAGLLEHMKQKITIAFKDW